jgi:hypothetical protein
MRPRYFIGLALFGFFLGVLRPSAEERAAKLRAACARSDGSSCERLGDEIERGKFAPRFAEEAGLAFAAACQAGRGGACERAQRWSKRYGDSELMEVDVGCMLEENAFACQEVAESLADDDDERAGGADALRRAADRSKRALDMHLAACAKGHSESCLGASRVYAAGIGVDWSPNDARTFAARACELGLARGCEELGDLSSGADAISAYRRACDTASVHGCAKVAKAATGAEASEFRRRACGLSDRDACAWIAARASDLDDEPLDVVRAFERFCDDGDARACALTSTRRRFLAQ